MKEYWAGRDYESHVVGKAVCDSAAIAPPALLSAFTSEVATVLYTIYTSIFNGSKE